MSVYRLVDATDEGTTVGSVQTLELPPQSVLVVSVPRDILDSDLARLRAELRAFFGQYDIGAPVAIIRGGDVKFLRLVPIAEAPAPGVSAEGAAWATEGER